MSDYATLLRSSNGYPARTVTSSPGSVVVAVRCAKAHCRVLAPGLAWLDPHLPADISHRSPLATAWRQLDHALDVFIAHSMIAA